MCMALVVTRNVSPTTGCPAGTAITAGTPRERASKVSAQPPAATASAAARASRLTGKVERDRTLCANNIRKEKGAGGRPSARPPEPPPPYIIGTRKLKCAPTPSTVVAGMAPPLTVFFGS